MKTKTSLAFFLLCILSACAARAPSAPKAREAEDPSPPFATLVGSRSRAEGFGERAAVSTGGKFATQAAIEILRHGGNAIDALIAASFTLGVERPHSTGIGGGGFLLFRSGKSGEAYAVDFRERAPTHATEKMYLDRNGDVLPQKSIDGALSVAIPGFVAGLTEIHQKFASKSWNELLEPAIRLAREGFPVYPNLAEALEKKKAILARFPSSAKIFLHSDGSPLREGEILKQLDLAKTLERIAREGRRGFYSGPIARSMLRTVHKNGGILSAEDLERYSVKWREPLRAKYQGYDLISMPPPSSGGVHVIEILKILETSLAGLRPLSASAIHLEASAMQLAFADRATYLGDPDFVPVPAERLISDVYARSQRARISMRRETPSSEVKAGKLPPAESTETSHISILDEQGNMVSSTQTINGPMGSSLVAEGSGIVLNNEMDDFSAKPGASNLFGAIGSHANSIAPWKTPLSSMSPTLVLKGGVPALAIGAPGGTRIITCVAQSLINYLTFHESLYDAIASVRFHHQWMPDRLDIDLPGPGEDVVSALQRMGYSIKLEKNAVPCRVIAVSREGGRFHAVSDPRDIGEGAGL